MCLDMRILIYGINFAPELTGIGKYTGELACWLRSRGHDIEVVTALPYYPEWRVGQGFSKWRYVKEVFDGFQVIRCPLYVPSKPNGLQRIVHLLSFTFFSFPALLWSARKRPDVIVVVVPASFCAPAAWLTARLVGAKCWLHVQDFEIAAAFEIGVIKGKWFKKLLLRFENWMIRRFDSLSTISNEMLKVLLAKSDREQTVSLFPNWIDLMEIYPLSGANRLRQEFNIDPNCIVLLYSGNMGLKQGLEVVVRAAEQLADDPNFVFLMCGDGVARTDLQQMAEGLPNIRWLPLQANERYNELLNLADIHLLPQNCDVVDLVMPSKLTGMLASGRPVIATTYPNSQVAKFVHTAGFIVAPGDVNGLVEAILRLASDPILRHRFGLAGRAIAEAEWEKNKVLRSFEDDLLDLLAESGKAHAAAEECD